MWDGTLSRHSGASPDHLSPSLYIYICIHLYRVSPKIDKDKSIKLGILTLLEVLSVYGISVHSPTDRVGVLKGLLVLNKLWLLGKTSVYGSVV